MKLHQQVNILKLTITIIILSFSCGVMAVPFTYQGWLTDGATDANGTYDFVFRLFDTEQLGAQVGSELTVDDVEVVNGLFFVDLDFGGATVYDGSTRWLEIFVKADADASYTGLVPRQPLYPAPHSTFSQTAPWSGLSNIPAGLDDGDDNTWPASGVGLSYLADALNVDFAGTGISTTAARSDHAHNWVELNNIPADLADGDDDTLPGAGTGLVYQGSDLKVHFAGTGSSVSAARADHNHDSVYSLDLHKHYSIGSDPSDPDSNLDLSSYNNVTAWLNSDSSQPGGFFEVKGTAWATVFTVDSSGNVETEGGISTINNAGDAIFVSQAGNPSFVSSSSWISGLEIAGSEGYGVRVGVADKSGLYINRTGEDGIFIGNAGNHGISISNTILDGIRITGAGGFSIYSSTAAPTYFNGDLGVGIIGPLNKLHVREALNGAASVSNHVAQIENSSTGTSPDVLLLKIGEVKNSNGSNIDVSNNFISFVDGNNISLGAIQGNNAGSVYLAGAGNDYAEYLPRLDPLESIQPGDIVGVFNGHVTKVTEGADRLMVSSTGAIVAGNDPGDELRADYTLVAFIGQVRMRIKGPVQAGSLILPSGLNDGIGIAVSPETLTIADAKRVIGQAWEDVNGDGLNEVGIAVGLMQTDVVTNLVQQMDSRLRALEEKMERVQVSD